MSTVNSPDSEISRFEEVLSCCLNSGDPNVIEGVKKHLAALSATLKQEFANVIIEGLLSRDSKKSKEIIESSPAAKELAQMLRQARGEKNMAVDALSMAASVSNNSILDIETPNDPTRSLSEKFKVERAGKKVKWGQILVQLARGLGLQDEYFLKKFEDVIGYAFSPDQIDSMKKAATNKMSKK